MMTQTNIEVVTSIYDAFKRGDLSAILNRLSPAADLQFEGPSSIPWAGAWRGREEWAKFFEAIGTNLSDIVVDMKPFAAEGDNVVFLGRYQARVRQTGRQIDSPLVHLWTVQNGLVSRCVELTNTAAEALACESQVTTNAG